MTLRPELLPAPHRYYTHLIAASAGAGIAGSLIAAIALASAPEPIQSIAIESPILEPQVVTVSSRGAALEDGPVRDANAVHFVFELGSTTYVALESFGVGASALPKHGTQTLSEGDGEVVSARVAAADVPAYLQMNRLRFDNGCLATVTDYALITRLTGETAYSSAEGEAWTIATIMDQGETVLAARVTGCTEGLLARDAVSAPIVVLAKHKAKAELANTARSALLASEAAHNTQREWKNNNGEGHWRDHVALEPMILRHPTTGVTWIAIHANWSEGGCGGPSVNMLGLFRVTKAGTLETVETRFLEDVFSISAFVDIDEDGTPEIVGRDWLGMDEVLSRANGEMIQMLNVPFYGCPC